MTQTLHIFRKDVRSLRWELGIVGALTVAFAWSHIADVAAAAIVRTDAFSRASEFSRAEIMAYVSSVLLVAGWWFLVSQLIHREALPGDRQFWVTRPYKWKQLLGAKVLFVLAFVNGPLLVAQMVILVAAGLSPLTGFPRLLWMQFTVVVVLLAAPFALATVTRSLVQVVLPVLCALVGLYFVVGGSNGSLVSWQLLWWTNVAAATTVICAGAALVIGWQYSVRHTGASIFVGLFTLVLAGALYVYLPPTFRYAVESWIYRQPDARAVSVTLGRPFAFETQSSRLLVTVRVPFSLANVPTDAITWPEAVRLTIEAPGGLHESSGWMIAPGSFFPPTSHAQSLYFDREFYRRIAGRTVSLQASFYLRLQNTTRVHVTPGGTTSIPGGGSCEVSTVDKMHAIVCTSPFRSPYDGVQSSEVTIDHSSDDLISLWQSPWPAEFALSPVFHDEYRCPVVDTISLVREPPHAWVRRDLRATVQLPPALEVKP